MSKYCIFCKVNNPDNVSNCLRCGKLLRESESPVSLNEQPNRILSPNYKKSRTLNNKKVGMVVAITIIVIAAILLLPIVKKGWLRQMWMSVIRFFHQLLRNIV